MSAKQTTYHMSPRAGLQPCGADKGLCPYRPGGSTPAPHFDEHAAKRIMGGNPKGYQEFEAMKEHQKALSQKSAPNPVQALHSARNAQAAATSRRADRVNSEAEILYHKDIGFPANFRAPQQRVFLDYTHHALEAAADDRYGDMPILKGVDLSKVQVVELGVKDGRVSKMVVRGRLDQERDMILVLIPRGKQPWTVKTVWVNMRDDKHRTLDHSKYVNPANVAA